MVIRKPVHIKMNAYIKWLFGDDQFVVEFPSLSEYTD